MASGNDWTTGVGNLWMAQNKWAPMSRILGKEGENARTLGTIFKDVVQVVLLFGSETWVEKLRMVRMLGGFQKSVAR